MLKIKAYGKLGYNRATLPGDTISLIIDNKIVHSQYMKENKNISCFAYVEVCNYPGYIVGDYDLIEKLVEAGFVNEC